MPSTLLLRAIVSVVLINVVLLLSDKLFIAVVPVVLVLLREKMPAPLALLIPMLVSVLLLRTVVKDPVELVIVVVRLWFARLVVTEVTLIVSMMPLLSGGMGPLSAAETAVMLELIVVGSEALTKSLLLLKTALLSASAMVSARNMPVASLRPSAVVIAVSPMGSKIPSASSPAAGRAAPPRPRALMATGTASASISAAAISIERPPLAGSAGSEQP